MDLDLKSGVITFRVLYSGPQGASKFLNLRGLHAGADPESKLAVLRTEQDRVVTLPLSPSSSIPVLGLSVRFVAMSAPGKVHASAVEKLLLQAADAIVFLPDRSEPAGKESRRALASLSSLCHAREEEGGSPIPFFIQDYVDGEPRLQNRHLDRESSSLSPRFMAVEGDTASSVQNVFDAACEAIIERYRDMEERMGEAPARAEVARQVNARMPVEAPKPLRTSRWVMVLILIAAAAGAYLFTAGL